MDKNSIKRFAVWARRELISRVAQRAELYGVKADGYGDIDAESIDGRVMSYTEKEQRTALIKKIISEGYEAVIEEIAYTWFNRFIALRYMEVNGYLPTRTRVFTNDEGRFRPQILDEAIYLDLDGLDTEKVIALKDANETEALYRYLLITQCNALNKIMPVMFQELSDYTELLLPNYLLREGSIIDEMVKQIPEDDWKDQVQIIGWLYQYYISEKHNEIVNIYKGTIKKADIPAATQLFTTDWVVRYMVDNSLGRYWIERNPDSTLKDKLDYFATPKDGIIKYIDEKVSPTDLTFLDPCMGSGHILVYAFDVLMEIYRECGYTDGEAAQSIVENNLYGLDIDKRAYQLAYFAVVMKARSYNRRIFSKNISPNFAYFNESNTLDKFAYDGLTTDSEQNKIGEYLIEAFKDAQEIGSLQTIEKHDYKAFSEYLLNLDTTKVQSDIRSTEWLRYTKPVMLSLAKQADIMSRRYTTVCTNPPYMNKLEGELKKFVVKNYKPYSGDLFSVFIYRNFWFCKPDGYSAFMTPFVWMFIKTYENLRQYIIENKKITTLVQMDYSAFEEATVPICTFVLKNGIDDESSLCFRLSDFKGDMEVQKKKVLEAIANPDCGYFYEANQANFAKIPGSPVAYWVSENVLLSFENGIALDTLGNPRVGLQTGDNARFLRLWQEVEQEKTKLDAINREDALCSVKKWFPYNKGGEYRKWYGNNDYVVNWENDGSEIQEFKDENGKLRSRPQNMDCYFKPAITWSKISSGNIAFRFKPAGHIFDVAGTSVFADDSIRLYLLGFCNSNVALKIANILSPTLNYEVGHISSFPVIISKSKIHDVEVLVDENIDLSRADWDAFETSWDFKRHPLI